MTAGRAEHLVTMANDIAHYFVAQGDAETAAREIASHIKGAWDPRMRRKIIEYLHAGGDGLEDLTRRAITELATVAPDPLDGDR